MRILTVASVFPPKIIGGAELSAYALSLWLKQAGHEVGVVTVAETPEEQLRGEAVDGLRIWRLTWPRFYTQHNHKEKSRLSKGLWHLQDHFDPRNKTIVRQVIEEFRPEIISVHVAQGIGHNAINPADWPNVPVIYFLHDLTLACIRTTMFRNDRNCERQCATCALSSRVKLGILKDRKNVHFISPSAANLETLRQNVHLESPQCHVVPNVDLSIVAPHGPRIDNKVPNFIYVGRLDKTKGVAFLLNVLSDIADLGHIFRMTVVGRGPEENVLRSKYSEKAWVRFTGQVPPEAVQDYLQCADLFLLPSLWRENHPGVVRQALRAGVPVIVSDIGGSKEMIINGESGLILGTGDSSSWKEAILSLLANQHALNKLRSGALRLGATYSADALGARIINILTNAIKNTANTASPIVEIENHRESKLSADGRDEWRS
jgi:glycosyltransferase involved in cell wall biosynthesis